MIVADLSKGIMTDSSSTGSPKGWKKGLPLYGLKTAEETATKLWQSARLGSVSTDVFAKALGLKGKGGSAWDMRMALLRGYKLVTVDGDQVSLSPLGQRLINASDKEQQLAARREAMRTLKAYKDLLDTYVNTPVPEKASLAGKLEFEYGKTPANADTAAQAFLDSLVFAEMIAKSGLVRLDGEDPTGDNPGSEDDEDDRAADDLDAALDELEAEQREEALVEDEVVADDEGQLVQRGSAGNTSLTVTLDLSQFRVDEVVRILREIGLAGRK